MHYIIKDIKIHDPDKLDYKETQQFENQTQNFFYTFEKIFSNCNYYERKMNKPEVNT